MMKRIPFFDIFAVLGLGLAWLLVFSYTPPRERALLDYVPATAMIYAQQREGDEAVEEGTAWSLPPILPWPLGNDQSFQAVGEVLGALVGIQRLAMEGRALLVEAGFKTQTLGVALLPEVAPTSSRPALSESIIDNLVFWIKANDTSHAHGDILARISRSRGAESISASQYGRHRIMRIAAGGRRLAAVSLGEVVAFAADERQLRRAIDVFDRDKPSLGANHRLAELVPSEKPAPWRLFYADIAGCISLSGKLGGKLALPMSASLPLTEIVYRENRGEGRIGSLLFLGIDPAKVDRKLARVFAREAGSPKVLFPDTDGTMLWLWSNSLPVAALFDGQKEGQDGESVRSDPGCEGRRELTGSDREGGESIAVQGGEVRCEDSSRDKDEAGGGLQKGVAPSDPTNLSDGVERGGALGDVQDRDRESFRPQGESTRHPALEMAAKVADLFSNEVLIVADPGENVSRLALPAVLLTTRVDDERQAESLLGELFSLLQVPTSAATAGTAVYRYWSDSPQDGLCPLYGFFNGHLFVGNSRSLVQRLFAGSGAGQVGLIEGQRRFAEADVPFNGHALLTVDNRQFVDVLRGAVEVFVTLSAIEDRERARRYRTLADALLSPLFQGLQSLPRSLVRLAFTADAIKVEAVFAFDSRQAGRTTTAR